MRARIRFLLTGLLFLALCPNARAQTPSHNWTFDIGSATFGVIGFGDFSYVFYGFGSFTIHLSPELIAFISLGILTLGLLTVGFALSLRRRPRAGSS